MCGIGGIISFKKIETNKDKQRIKNITEKLLIGLQSRGRDATGISSYDFYKNNFNISKRNLKAEEFIKTNQFKEIMKKDFNVLLLHTRATTSGTEKENVNNHPHLNKKTNNILIHNGVINNDEELSKKYKLKLDGKCDSEVILKLIDKIGYKKAFKEITGSYAIAFSNYKDRTINLFRGNYSPLYVALYGDLFIFASEKEIIEESINKPLGKNIEGLDFEFIGGNYYLREFETGDFMQFCFKDNSIKTKILETKTYTYVKSSYTYSKNEQKKESEEDLIKRDLDYIDYVDDYENYNKKAIPKYYDCDKKGWFYY